MFLSRDTVVLDVVWYALLDFLVLYVLQWSVRFIPVQEGLIRFIKFGVYRCMDAVDG